MNTPEQVSPTLVILEDEGDFTVRVGAQPNAKQISATIVPLLAGLGAKKLLLITPLDTKMYKFDGRNGNGNDPSKSQSKPAAAQADASSTASTPRQRVFADEGAPPQPDEAMAEYERIELEERQAEKVAREMAALNRVDALPAEPAEEPEPAPQAPRKRQKAETKVEGATAACGRCQGNGSIPGGGVCPVCRGKGQVAKWGRKR